MKSGGTTIAQGSNKSTSNKPKVAMDKSGEEQCRVEKYSWE